MKLTHANYFTKNNNYLSNSKISDFIKNKKYFYEKHITRTIENKPTPSMVIGSAVDTYLTVGKSEFNKMFSSVARRNVKNPPTGYTEILESDYKKVLTMCENVEYHPVYTCLSKYTSQKILQIDNKVGKYFDGLCGIPDWYKITKAGLCTIVDLKTTKNVQHKDFHYTCRKYGYYRQQAFYQMLLKNNYPQIKSFTSRILAVENNGMYDVQIFEIDKETIEQEKEYIMEVVKNIISEKDYKIKKLYWKSAQKLPYEYEI